ncbi:50S ribosome-binding GTPase [Salmonella enterica subsp. enterica serovar Concord]|nr:50S ribosome-binding GTPase [Salmonella enterica subsp. enterica serovar Concord]
MTDYKEFLDDSYNYETDTLNAEKAKEIAEQKKGKFNIILLGATGTGKSTLVNAVFGENIAKSGVGKPVTQHLEKITIPGKGLVLWDTKGIEAKDYQETVSQLEKEISTSFDEASHVDDIPHLGWLCIDSGSGRFEDRDFDLIKIFKMRNIPIVVVFTKMLGNDSYPFIDSVKENIKNSECCDYINERYAKVNSVERSISDSLKIPVSGLDELLEISFKCLQEGREHAEQSLKAVKVLKALETFKKAQIVKKGLRLEAMKEGAKKIVHIAAAAAGSVGATPIPGSDAPLIAAVQSAMIYKINAEFELDASDSKITSVVGGILGVTAIAQVGKTIVANALKFIPGVGSIIGGAISATTAVALTEAVGHAYIKVLTFYYNNDTGYVELPENVKSILEVFKNNFSYKNKKL